LFCLLWGASLAALDPPPGAAAFDDNGDGRPDRWEFFNQDGGLSIYLDTKGSGKVSYLLDHDREALRVREALDFNGDGELDDFYYYANDVLVRRELDTNYDGRIDVWVYLEAGVYITRYERDKDYDGIPELVKVFVP
jgi:hypothetical protein